MSQIKMTMKTVQQSPELKENNKPMTNSLLT